MPSEKDIVERLKAEANWRDNAGHPAIAATLREASAAIEVLRAEVNAGRKLDEWREADRKVQNRLSADLYDNRPAETNAVTHQLSLAAAAKASAVQATDACNALGKEGSDGE